MKFIFLVIILSIFLKLSVSKDIKLCKNGGVSLNNKDCFCPLSYSGSNCEFINETDICTQAIHPNGPFGNICCWHKYRSDSNLTEMKATMYDNELNSENDKIQEIFKMYGPWRPSDIQLANILIDKDETNGEYFLKYHSNNSTNKKKYSCDDIENQNPIAFTLMVHHIDLEAIDTLLQLLYKPYHYFSIHVDNRFDKQDLLEKLQDYLSSFEHGIKINTKYENYPSNIKMMSNRFIGSWGAISLVYMELASYATLFDMAKERSLMDENSQWSHVINLSLNDMPTISISKLTKQLCENYNTNYLDENCVKVIDRFENIHLDYAEEYTNFEPVMISHELVEKYQCGKNGMLNYYNRDSLLDGSQWHILTSSYANYLIGNVRSIEKLFSFKFSEIPDETFYQSSKRFYPLVDEEIFSRYSYRITMWDNNPFRCDKYRYVVNLEDVDKIHEGALFVRKVYTNDVKDAIIKKFNLNEINI